jgi:hypothetical protein
MNENNEHYAEVEENTIVGVFVCDDPQYAEEMGWYALEGLDPMPWLGWTYDGETWSAPPPEDLPERAPKGR